MTHPAAESALSYIKSKPEYVLRKNLEWLSVCTDELSVKCRLIILSMLLDGYDAFDEFDEIDIIALAYVMQQGEG